MHELVGNMHMHTPYSDGMKWHAEIAEDAIRAGLDFVIVTDHNIWVDGVEGYYENGDGRVLLLVGEEVHNVRRQPQASHFLVYGAEREMSCYADDPQKLIDETNKAQGYGFLAHPYDIGISLFDQPDLGWKDWDIEGYTGLEIWNYMSNLAGELSEKLEAFPLNNVSLAKAYAAYLSFSPEKHMAAACPQTLALWDELLAQGKRVAAVGSSDAHGVTMSVGPIARVIYPYEFLFRAVNTHLLAPEPLSGDLEKDKGMVLRAIGKGNSWVGYDMPHSTKGFRFTGQGTNKGSIGDDIELDVGATLQVKTPAKAHIQLIYRGEVVAETMNETHLMHIPVEEGAYRVECKIMYEGAKRGWIYSNPIYLH